MQSVEDVKTALFSLVRTGIKPGLIRIRRLLSRLSNPEKQYISILITGTNGKGSTAAFIENILRKAGFKTGLFTSPHLIDIRERICIAGESIGEKDFWNIAMEVISCANSGRVRVHPTFFEAMTAIGFLAFAYKKVDVAVVEVGMGGRWDSTNTLDPIVSVLTNVSLDHEKYLGPTLEDIAREKVAVARKGRYLITGVNNALYETVVYPKTKEIGATPLLLGRDFFVSQRDGVIDWRGRHRQIEGAVLSLKGTFQTENAGIALSVVEALEDLGLKVKDIDYIEGLRTTKWQGRFDKVCENPTVILDGCHNIGGAERLYETLERYPPKGRFVIIHSSKPEKAFEKVLARIAPLADVCIETTIEGLCPVERLVDAARRAGAKKVFGYQEFESAFGIAKEIAGSDGTILITGSLYLVGHALKIKPWKVDDGCIREDSYGGSLKRF